MKSKKKKKIYHPIFVVTERLLVGSPCFAVTHKINHV